MQAGIEPPPCRLGGALPSELQSDVLRHSLQQLCMKCSLWKNCLIATKSLSVILSVAPAVP